VPYPYSLAAALALAAVCLFGYRLRASSHRRRWISIAAGVSVATIFVDLLPELSEKQAAFSKSTHRAALFPEQAIFLSAMLGFVLFYGLEYMMAGSNSTEERPSSFFFSLQIAAFAAYSSLIAYLLVHNIWNGVSALFLYSVAMGFHLLLVDHSLAKERHGLYEQRGRWILALAIMAGWSAGVFEPIPEHWIARITGFVAGGVIMNSLIVELPEGRGGHFWFFASAAAIYSLILIGILG
jgi:hypothetical protein